MIGAVILAAGRSRRMGRPKLLLPWRGQPLITHVVDQVLRSPVDQAVVVVGPDERRIPAALAGRAVSYAVNPRPEREMLGSVRCGLRALSPAWVAALIVLGDQPGITAEVLAQLVGAFQTRPLGILVPVHGGRRGHPLLVTRRYRDEILSRYDEVGLRGLLEAHADDVAEVQVAVPGVLVDIDTPEDYRRLVAPDSPPAA
jgi:molybdenum cofactor cytidylyltransferase